MVDVAEVLARVDRAFRLECDVFRCVHCKRAIYHSSRDRAFEHAHYCRHRDETINPWTLIRAAFGPPQVRNELLTVLRPFAEIDGELDGFSDGMIILRHRSLSGPALVAGDIHAASTLFAKLGGQVRPRTAPGYLDRLEELVALAESHAGDYALDGGCRG